MSEKFKKIIFTAIVSIAVWGVVEVFFGNFFLDDLRKWAAPPPTKRSEINLFGNPYLIFENVPGVWKTNNQEVNFTANINQFGFRGPQIITPKPDGIRRFITTGDSSVYGFGVNDDQVFSSVAEQQLGYKAEAINAAVPGYSSFQSVNLMRIRGLKVEPDLLVIANIWSDNNFDAFIDKEVLALYSGYEESFWGRTKKILSKSAIYRVLDWRLRLRDRQDTIIQKRKVGWQVGSQEHLGLRRVEINDYAQNLETMVQMAKANQAEVIFVLLANEEDMQGNLGDKAWTPYREVMQATANRHGAPLIHVPKIFKASGLSTQDLFLDEMHPSIRGHKIMGKALADVLQSYDWVNGGKIMSKGDGSSIPDYTDPFIKEGTPLNPSNANFSGKSGVIKLSGTVKFDGFTSGFIQIDAIAAGSRNAAVIHMTKLKAPGEFNITIGTPRKIAVRAYIDAEGDGPDADDPLIDLSKTVIHLDQNPKQKVFIDLDKRTVTAAE